MTEQIWCLSSSQLGNAALGLLGPATAVWFWQVWRAKSYTSSTGPQTSISKATTYASRARSTVLVVSCLWVATLVLYSGTFISVHGKGCDATFSNSGQTWVMWFGISLAPLIVAFLWLGWLHLQFRRYDEAPKEEARSLR